MNQYDEEKAQTRVRKWKASERKSDRRGASEGSLEERDILLDGLTAPGEQQSPKLYPL